MDLLKIHKNQNLRKKSNVNIMMQIILVVPGLNVTWLNETEYGFNYKSRLDLIVQWELG